MTAATSAAASNHLHNGPPAFTRPGLLYFYWPFASDKTLIYGWGGEFSSHWQLLGKKGEFIPEAAGKKVLLYLFIYFFFYFPPRQPFGSSDPAQDAILAIGL